MVTLDKIAAENESLLPETFKNTVEKAFDRDDINMEARLRVRNSLDHADMDTVAMMLQCLLIEKYGAHSMEDYNTLQDEPLKIAQLYNQALHFDLEISRNETARPEDIKIPEALKSETRKILQELGYGPDSNQALKMEISMQRPAKYNGAFDSFKRRESYSHKDVQTLIDYFQGKQTEYPMNTMYVVNHEEALRKLKSKHDAVYNEHYLEQKRQAAAAKKEGESEIEKAQWKTRLTKSCGKKPNSHVSNIEENSVKTCER